MQFKKIIDKNENNINIYMFFKKKLWNHNYLGKFLTYTKKKRKIIISTNKAMELYNYQASTYSKSSTEMKKKKDHWLIVHSQQMKCIGRNKMTIKTWTFKNDGTYNSLF